MVFNEGVRIVRQRFVEADSYAEPELVESVSMQDGIKPVFHRARKRRYHAPTLSNVDRNSPFERQRARKIRLRKDLEEAIDRISPAKAFTEGDFVAIHVTEEAPKEVSSILFDASGNPIIKTFYHKGDFIPKGKDDTKHHAVIAGFDAAEDATVTFELYEDLSIRCNCALTNYGYQRLKRDVKGYLKKGQSHKAKTLKFTVNQYSYCLMHDGYIFIMKAPFRPNQFSLAMMPQKTIIIDEDGSQREHITPRPKCTNDEFNTYVYRAILDMAAYFRKALHSR